MPLGLTITDEDELLRDDFRKGILDEIMGEENKARKTESLKRFDIVKDNTKKYVIEKLRTELLPETVSEMIARTPNISIGKKIIEKKAQVYRHGATRIAFVNGEVNEDAQGQIDSLTDFTNLNSQMKKVNKILELQKNCMAYVRPVFDMAKKGWKIKLDPLHPHFYDVVPDANDPEQERVVIFSYFNEERTKVLTDEDSNLGGDRASIRRSGNLFREGDNVKQRIADSPQDEGESQLFVWWSNKYHFITDAKGLILRDKSPEDLLNPIQMLPFVNFALDQDGSFWSVGGEDVSEGSILINLLMADLYFIAKVQGMGLFYMFGTNVPETLKWGPGNAITGKIEKDDPSVQIGFASSNPPLGEHMNMIEQFIALLLTTNNLEPGTVQGKLSATSANSGIQEIIRKSELSGDIEDQKELFRDNEPLIYELIFKWQDLYLASNALIPELQSIGSIPEGTTVKVALNEAQEFLTEKEKLEVIKTRLELRLDSMIDALIRDNPDLTQDEAREKLKRIMKDKLEEARVNMERFIVDQVEQPKKEEEEEKEEEEKEGEDNADKQEQIDS